MSWQIESEGGSAIVFKVDVSKQESVRELVEVTLKTYSQVDVLVNNFELLFRGDENFKFQGLYTRNRATRITILTNTNVPPKIISKMYFCDPIAKEQLLPEQTVPIILKPQIACTIVKRIAK